MMIPPADLSYIAEAFRTATDPVREAFEDSDEPSGPGNGTPDLLAEAMERLFDVLHGLETGGGDEQPLSGDRLPATKDLHQLGDYGIDLLTQLAAWAGALRLPQQRRELELLTFPLALWLAQRGAEISNLEPVVNALAVFANRNSALSELEELYVATGEIMEAVSPAIALDLDRANPGRPWRILVLNRAIVATRSHQPGLMEQAFQSLGELLPEDAPGFFREGMEQMDALDYPAHVRVLMEKYYQLWCAPKTLH